ncbi:MAG TPA: peptidoglycan DD-metalloendopeptidase family protein [Nocardioidaceae bacterium]
MVAPIPGADVTCEFGVKGSWAAGYHTGRDYRARTPLRVNATCGGHVVFAGEGAEGWGPAYGIHVVVESRGVRHLYAHLSRATVRSGQPVRKGQQVGLSGNTGNTSGPHLHYEERTRPYAYANHRRPSLDRQSTGSVDLDLVVAAFHKDPDRPQGKGIHPRAVRIVEQALTAEGLLPANLGTDGYAGTATRDAYRRWQQRLGFRKADADGIPGITSLTALGDKYGFGVTRKKRDRTLSASGARMIGEFEGFRGELYDDPAGHCTIGYGHLVHKGACNGSEPAAFKKGLTQAEARRLLREDARPAGDAVNRLVTVPLSQAQFDALTSFVYNLGAGSLAESQLLRRLNAGEYDAVPTELAKWVNAGGKKLPGLVKRRAAEGGLFATGTYPGARPRARAAARP